MGSLGAPNFRQNKGYLKQRPRPRAKPGLFSFVLFWFWKPNSGSCACQEIQVSLIRLREVARGWVSEKVAGSVWVLWAGLGRRHSGSSAVCREVCGKNTRFLCNRQLLSLEGSAWHSLRNYLGFFVGCLSFDVWASKPLWLLSLGSIPAYVVASLSLAHT